jgi:hypothetical protein
LHVFARQANQSRPQPLKEKTMKLLSRYDTRIQRTVLRLAVDCDLAGGIGLAVVSKAAGLSAAAASAKLAQYVEAGLLEEHVVGRTCDRYAYFITDAGQRWLQQDVKEQPIQSIRLNFGPLLAHWGPSPKLQF